MKLIKVTFYGEQLDVVTDNDTQFVSVKTICNFIGIDDKTQITKIKSNPAYEAKLIEAQTAGGIQKIFCIPLKKLNGWLFTINPNKVKSEIKEKLIKYQNECFEVLHNHFNKKAQQPLALPENLNAMANGYKRQLKRKQNQIEKLKSELAQCRKELEKCKSEHTEIWKEEAITQKKRAEKAEELAEHFRKMAAYQVHKIMIFTEAIEKLESIRSSFTSQLSIYCEITSIVNMLKDYLKKADEYITYLHIDPIIPKLKYST